MQTIFVAEINNTKSDETTVNIEGKKHFVFVIFGIYHCIFANTPQNFLTEGTA